LLNEVNALKARMDAGERVNVTSVYTFLSTWLRHHILEVDMKLAATLQHGTALPA
jgi:hemerythrin